MKGLRNKLKDQCGASILLALLFFLLCSMVGSSVLMAAMSNAGKVRSNREEQRKYLLLSSALRLVCDELTSAEYYGQYQYKTETWTETVDIEGVETSIQHIRYTYTQISGDFQCGLSKALPLTDELDLIFAPQFSGSRTQTEGLTVSHYVYTPLNGSFASGEHELILRVDAPEVEGLDKPENMVTVKARLDQDLRIRLTAALGTEEDGYIYTMEAQLTGRGSLALAAPGSAADGAQQAGPVTWALEWIAKKEAGDGT